MSQMNRNAAYIYEVDGLTPWERLRVIRNFLKDRKQALALAELSKEELENDKKTLENNPNNYELKRKILENCYLDDNIEDAKDEIAFLEELEGKLVKEAELTRIEGKTDKEMYEINFYNEKIERNLLQIKAEVISTGHVNPNTLKQILREPETIKKACELNLLPQDAINLVPKQILLENKK